jgi:uncharacterized protein (DUF2147 family)
MSRVIEMKKHLVCGALVAGFMASMSLPSFAGSGPEGVWAMTNKKVTVKIAYCGGKNLCATIVGLSQPISKIDGKPKVDRNNPNESLRSRPLMGLTVINGMVPNGDNAWKGKIYNADDGSTYRSFAKLDGDQLVVKGCFLIICKDMDFVRVK